MDSSTCLGRERYRDFLAVLENYVASGRCLLDSVHGKRSHGMTTNGAAITWLTPDREKLVEGKVSVRGVDFDMDGS